MPSELDDGTLARKTAMQGSALSLATKSASRKPGRNGERRSASRQSKAAAEDADVEAQDAADLKAVADRVAVAEGTLATSGEHPRTASPRSV